jgi:alpha-L-arabinofuranosidase
LYAPHQGGTSVRTLISAPHLSGTWTPGLPALAGSCSLHGKRAVLTVVNPDVKNAQETEIDVLGARISSVRATTLTSSDIHARNTFDEPHALEPISKHGAGRSPLMYHFEPASVTRLELELS